MMVRDVRATMGTKSVFFRWVQKKQQPDSRSLLQAHWPWPLPVERILCRIVFLACFLRGSICAMGSHGSLRWAEHGDWVGGHLWFSYLLDLTINSDGSMRLERGIKIGSDRDPQR